MKIAVCLKEVLDARLPLQVEARTGLVIQTGSGRVDTLNPADRSALEAAMELRSQIPGARVEAFSVCDVAGQQALWFARARGVDSVQRIENSSALVGAPFTAALLAARFENGGYDLICCGDETLDHSSAMVGPLVAEMLDLPQVTGVLRLAECSAASLVVERGLERGNRELVEMELPGLITVKSEGFAPRYVSFRKLVEARSTLVPSLPSEFQDGRFHLPQWPADTSTVTPRARVKKSFTPDANISPAERMRMIMAGGMAGGMAPQESKSRSSVVEGDADYVSEQLYRFLKHHEFV